MTAPGSPKTTTTQPASSGDLPERLTTLRARMENLQPDSAIERVMAGVSEAVDRMSVEHAGMAQELLSVYEQLGVVFDVTRKLPNVQDESEVIDLFVGSLSQSFEGHTVFAVRANAAENAPLDEAPSASGPWLDDLIHRAEMCGNVQVERSPEGAVAPDVASRNACRTK